MCSTCSAQGLASVSQLLPSANNSPRFPRNRVEEQPLPLKWPIQESIKLYYHDNTHPAEGVGKKVGKTKDSTVRFQQGEICSLVNLNPTLSSKDLSKEASIRHFLTPVDGQRDSLEHLTQHVSQYYLLSLPICVYNYATLAWLLAPTGALRGMIC